MYTSMLLVALTAFPTMANVEDAPAWLTDYSQARKQGMNEKKPLAVFVASGKNGWKKLAKDGELGKEIEKTLAASYVCVHINSASDDGKRLAKALGVDGGLGLVISDSSGRLMAFHHEGDLANRDLSRYLTKYGDPERAVEYTESNPAPTYRSYYPPPQAAPTLPFNFGGGGGGRSC